MNWLPTHSFVRKSKYAIYLFYTYFLDNLIFRKKNRISKTKLIIDNSKINQSKPILRLLNPNGVPFKDKLISVPHPAGMDIPK